MRRLLAIAWQVLWPAFVVLSLAVMALAIAIAAPGCTQRQAQTAATVTTESAAVAGSVGVRLLAAAEQVEGLREVERSTSLDDARARLAAVEARYEGAWMALDALAVAQDVAADALEAGELPDLAALGRALCAAALAVAAFDVALPGTEACK